MDIPHYLRSWSVPEDETLTILNPPEPKMNFQGGYIIWYTIGILSILCVFQAFHEGINELLILALVFSFVTLLLFPPHLILAMYQLLEVLSIITAFIAVRKLQTSWILIGILEVFVIFVCRIWYHISEIRSLEQDIRDLTRKIKSYRGNQTLIRSYLDIREQLWSKRMTHLVIGCLLLFIQVDFMFKLKPWD